MPALNNNENASSVADSHPLYEDLEREFPDCKFEFMDVQSPTTLEWKSAISVTDEKDDFLVVQEESYFCPSAHEARKDAILQLFRKMHLQRDEHLSSFYLYGLCAGLVMVFVIGFAGSIYEPGVYFWTSKTLMCLGADWAFVAYCAMSSARQNAAIMPDSYVYRNYIRKNVGF